jgi:hypothetical protein
MENFGGSALPAGIVNFGGSLNSEGLKGWKLGAAEKLDCLGGSKAGGLG